MAAYALRETSVKALRQPETSPDLGSAEIGMLAGHGIGISTAMHLWSCAEQRTWRPGGVGGWRR